MVKNILSAAGFIENKTFKESHFRKPPKETYAVYLDALGGRGSDDANLIFEHGYTIEVYSYALDKEVENRIEKALNDRGISYTKQPRYWLESEQLYQVIYEFDYIEKIGG